MAENQQGVSVLSSTKFINLLNSLEEGRQRSIALARDYHDGNQGVELTHRLKQFLTSYNRGHQFNLNVCRSVITALSERLSVTGFDSADKGLIAWAAGIWRKNLMAAIQDDVYKRAIRDGEYFVIIGWDFDEGRARWTPHERYVSIEAGGNDFGCVAKYVQNDSNQRMLYVTKFWTEEEPDGPRKYKNVYYPDRIEKFKMSDQGEWVHRNDPEDPVSEEFGTILWPVPWTMPDGTPIGIPVIHFKNPDLRCEAWDAIPIQDAVNKELLDLLLAGDQTAFRIYVALGFIPTTDGKPLLADRSNLLQIEPGTIVATDHGPQEADFKAINGQDLTPLQNLVHQLIMWLAMVTETPITRYTTTKLVASDETLKEQENPLLSRVGVRQVLFGSAWESCLQMSRKLERLWGDQTIDLETEIHVLWKDAQVRGEKEKLGNLKSKKDLDVPHGQLWKEAGYDQATIDAMESERQKELNDGRQDQQGSGTQTGGSSGSVTKTGQPNQGSSGTQTKTKA